MTDLIKRLRIEKMQYSVDYSDILEDTIQDAIDALERMESTITHLADKLMDMDWDTDMESAKSDDNVLAWRDDAGSFVAFFGSMELFNLSDEEIEKIDEDSFFQEDWWTFCHSGPCRLEGDLVPTKWMHLPE